MGGSLGAQRVNEALRQALPRLLPDFDVAHLCGHGNLDVVLEGTPGYCQKEFLDAELPDALACADLVLSRAGSNAIAEFQALAKPMLLVPYPVGASRGDQVLNAESFRRRGLCKVLLQENMNGETLASALAETWADREQLVAALKAAPPADGPSLSTRFCTNASALSQSMSARFPFVRNSSREAVFAIALLGGFGHHAHNAFHNVVNIGEVATAVAVVADLNGFTFQ